MRKLKLRFEECCSLFVLFIAYIVSLPLRRKNVWLVSERGDDARDNGYWFFRYMQEEHPEVESFFIIDIKSKDYQKLEKYRANLIQPNSFKHYMFIWISSYHISTHVTGYAPYCRRFYQKMHSKYKIFGSRKQIFLQHGIIKDAMPQFYYEETHLDMFVCGAKYEYEFVKDTFHYPHNEVRYTGLCRYDGLLDFKTKPQILIMPTWRQYISKEKSEFEKSSYFLHYKNLLTDPRLWQLARDVNVDIIFYPHYEIQKFIDLFKNLELPLNIKIADFNYDVQQLLKESLMLITDFSSVYFDMCYMNKPVLLYQFDEEEYRAEHYPIGYLDVRKIGLRSETLDELIRDLKFTIDSGFVVHEKYKEYIDGMFEMRDKKNCERVYQNILIL